MAGRAASSSIVAALLLSTVPALGHGYAGARFFPATLTIEDPFVADELALPTISQLKLGDETETETSLEFAKRITPDFAFAIETARVDVNSPEGDVDGWGNVGTGLKRQIAKEDEAEFVASIALDVEWGGTGSSQLGVERVNTFTPSFLFGKGFGNFGEGSDWTRAFAITGFAGYAFPGKSKTNEVFIDPLSGLPDVEVEHHVGAFVYGAALEYSLPYLHANVRDFGWPQWVNQLTPVVELSFASPVTDKYGKHTTGTINPGIIWSGQSVQFSAEAIIPINSESGDRVGFALQMHFYLDDIFPRSIGRPIFGASS